MTTKTAEVKVGQVFRDRDPRVPNRFVKVTDIFEDTTRHTPETTAVVQRCDSFGVLLNKNSRPRYTKIKVRRLQSSDYEPVA